MADVLITDDLANGTATFHPYYPNIVMINKDTFYVFFASAASLGIKYTKSTDGGVTWETPVALHAGQTNQSVLGGIWYDRWTPGDTGTLIHIVYDSRKAVGGKKFEYVNLDTSDDTAGSTATVLDYSASGAAGTNASITKAEVGTHLYINVNGPSGNFFLRSTNGGSSWSSRATSGSTSGMGLNPAKWRSDTADVAAVTDSFNGGTLLGDLQLREFDNSANTWSSTNIVANLAGAANLANRASAIRLSDGHIIVAGLDAHSQRSTPAVGTHTGADNQTTLLTDSAALFVTVEKVKTSDTVRNNTDSNAIWDITAITETTLTVTLKTSGGGDDDWDTNDSYSVLRVTDFSDIKMRVFDTNGAASITEKTTITIDAEAGFTPALFVAPNNDIYITWVIGAAGSRGDAEYVKSADGGSTWSGGTSFPASSPTNIDYLGVPYAMPNGGIYAPDFADGSPSPDKLFINLDNSVAIVLSTPIQTVTVWVTQQQRLPWRS